MGCFYCRDGIKKQIGDNRKLSDSEIGVEQVKRASMDRRGLAIINIKHRCLSPFLRSRNKKFRNDNSHCIFKIQHRFRRKMVILYFKCGLNGLAAIVSFFSYLVAVIPEGIRSMRKLTAAIKTLYAHPEAGQRI